LNSKKLLIWLVIVVMAVFAAACGGNTEPAEESSGGDELQVAQELIVLTGSDASTFDPHFCTDSATEIFNKNMYNNLVRFNSEMELVPDLAESWSVSEDNLTWTFKLRQGVKFHDGTPFNAESVKVSFERVLNPDTGSPRRSVMEIIDKVEVVDESTVNITTKTPCGSLLQQLAHPVAAIISPTALDTYYLFLG
jgi:peptide/nickel transport system substrate-binding protein